MTPTANDVVDLYHNPRCTKSRQALEIATTTVREAGPGAAFDLNVIKYLDTPPSADELRLILGKLEDEPSKLVRRERWSELGIGADDVTTVDGVLDVLVRHPELMERPLIVTADRAFIGRPTERVGEFFAT